jgi:hypothetical protein
MPSVRAMTLLAGVEDAAQQAAARMQEGVERAIARTDKMAAEMEEARVVGRDALYRAALLSATIVGFSATFLSIKTVSARVDLSLLRSSWFLFAAVVAIAPMSVYVEARAKYAVSWRAIQRQNFDTRTLGLRDRVKFLGPLVYTVLVRPRNLIYARDTDFGDEAGGEKAAWLNSQMIQRLHVVWDLAIALELAVWPLFFAALVVLVLAIAP